MGRTSTGLPPPTYTCDTTSTCGSSCPRSGCSSSGRSRAGNRSVTSWGCLFPIGRIRTLSRRKRFGSGFISVRRWVPQCGWLAWEGAWASGMLAELLLEVEGPAVWNFDGSRELTTPRTFVDVGRLLLSLLASRNLAGNPIRTSRLPTGP